MMMIEQAEHTTMRCRRTRSMHTVRVHALVDTRKVEPLQTAGGVTLKTIGYQAELPRGRFRRNFP